MQRIFPMLVYADAPAAIDFLTRAFGFEERYRMDMDDGKVGHAELSYADSVLMLASEFPGMGFLSPSKLEARHGQVFCYVDDLDAHYERARAEGATIVSEPVDAHYGSRMYRALDPEGGRWMFSTPPAESD